MVDEPMSMFDGCEWVVGFGKKKKGHAAPKLFCGKLRQEASAFCPKHELFHQDSLKDEERKAAAARERKQAKQAELAELAQSPLAAYNPKFDNKNRPVRMDAEK
jgi:hypothetical protein